MKIFLLVLIILFPSIIFWILAWDNKRLVKRCAKIVANGIKVTGTITKREKRVKPGTYDSDGISTVTQIDYILEYTFSAGEQTYSRSIDVPDTTYDTIALGDQIEVCYLVEDPNQSCAVMEDSTNKEFIRRNLKGMWVYPLLMTVIAAVVFLVRYIFSGYI